MTAQFLPSPLDDEYPVLHEHVLVPGPVEVQLEKEPHPPLDDKQLLMGAQLIPLPEDEEYPVLHAHELVPGPV